MCYKTGRAGFHTGPTRQHELDHTISGIELSYLADQIMKWQYIKIIQIIHIICPRRALFKTTSYRISVDLI